MEIVMQNKKGFTIIETLIAMILFSLVLIFMLQSFLLTYKLNYEKLVKDETVKIAQEELERLRNEQYSNISSSCVGICNNFNPNNVDSSCIITRQVRNYNIRFGREITINENYPYKTVTLTVCSQHKDFQGNQIRYTLTTIISDKGF